MKKERQDRNEQRIGEIQDKKSGRTIYGQREAQYCGEETFDGVIVGKIEKVSERDYTVGIF